MSRKKTLPEGEYERRMLLATPAGRQGLQELESRYHPASGRPRPPRTSVITYTLVHGREQGLTDN